MDDNLIERRREAFERHMKKLMPSNFEWFEWFERNQNTYLSPSIEAHWLTWNAALDSAEVELPELSDLNHHGEFRRGLICATHAIERAGLRVKS